MAIVCPSCGKENRDQARFCRGCARPLDLPGGDAASDEVARERANRALRRARRRKRSGQRAEQQPAWWRWAGAMTAGVLVLAIGWWLGAHQSAPAPVQAAPLAAVPATLPSAAPPATAQPAAAEPAGAEAATSPSTPETAAAVDRLRHSVELLEQQDRERAVAQAQQRQKLALEQKRLDDARRRTEAASAAAAGAHPAAPETAPVAVATPAPSAPVAAAAATAPAARPAAGVDQVCAGSDNVFARDFCRIRECGKAVFANDPVCVRFRQMDEARRREAEYR